MVSASFLQYYRQGNSEKNAKIRQIVWLSSIFSSVLLLQPFVDVPGFTDKYKVNSGRQGYYQRGIDTRIRESQVINILISYS